MSLTTSTNSVQISVVWSLMSARLFSSAPSGSNGWVLWTRHFNWIVSVGERTVAGCFFTGHCGIRSSVQSKRRQSNRQTDREEWQEIEITRSTSSLRGMNHLTVSVTLSFSQPTSPSTLSSTLSADEWPFRSYLLWNIGRPSENRKDGMRKDRISILILTMFQLCLLLS